jgi:glycosyltransferase involved in cell wall biosynthesis
MRIVLVSNVYPPVVHGGCELLCEQSCRFLRKKGHDVQVLTSPATGHALSDPAAEGGVIRSLRLTLEFSRPPEEITLWHRWRAYRTNYHATRCFLQEARPDLVFFWSQRRLTLACIRAARDCGLPSAFTFNDEYITAYRPNPFSLAPRGMYRFLRHELLLPKNNTSGLPLRPATCISRTLQHSLVSQGMAIQDARVIYQGIALEQFPPKSIPGAISRPARILSVGLLSPQKGTDTLVSAAHLLAETVGPDAFTLSLVGDGHEGFVLSLRAKAAAGPARITFHGRIPHAEVAEVYRAHDVLVFASNALEAFGLTPLEAMASGTTVVSTARGGHGEMLAHEKNALVFEEGNAPQLAERLACLLREPALSLRLAQSARGMVARDFQIERYHAEIESFLLHALQPPRAAST